MRLGDRLVDRFGHGPRHADDHLVRHELRLRSWNGRLLGGGGRRLERRRLGTAFSGRTALRWQKRPSPTPCKRDRCVWPAAWCAPASKHAAAKVLPTFPGTATAIAVANPSCDADDVNGRGNPAYSARQRRPCIVGPVVIGPVVLGPAVIGRVIVV